MCQNEELNNNKCQYKALVVVCRLHLEWDSSYRYVFSLYPPTKPPTAATTTTFYDHGECAHDTIPLLSMYSTIGTDDCCAHADLSGDQFNSFLATGDRTF